LLSKLPRLYSFARDKISLAHYINNQDIHHNFHTPISQQAAQEHHELNQISTQVQQNQHDKDEWIYIWGSKRYTSSKFYSLNFKSIEAQLPFKWIRRSKITKKLKIFIWLVFRDRINPRNLLKGKNFNIQGGDYSCVLCNLHIEYTYHLLFQCPFSTECWNFLIFIEIMTYTSLMPLRREECQHDFFMEVFSSAAWKIWKQRNAKIFRAIAPSFHSWRDNFFSTVRHQMYRLSEDNRLKIHDWISTFS
jgi:hypothetical protein